MSSAPTRGPVMRPGDDRDFTEIFQRLDDIERVRVGGLQFHEGTYGPLNVGDWLYIQTTGGGGPLGRAFTLQLGPDGYRDLEINATDGVIYADLLLNPYQFDLSAQTMNFSTLNTDVGGGGGGSIAIQAQTLITLVATQPGEGNIEFHTQGEFFAEMNDWLMTGTGSSQVDFTGQGSSANLWDFSGSYRLRAFTMLSSLEMDNSGDVTLIADQTMLIASTNDDVDVKIPAGKTFTIKSHTGVPQIQWTEGDVDVHIPSGGTIVADL